MSQVRALDIDGIMLAVDEARAEIEAMKDENAALRGRLRESRLEKRRLMGVCAAAQAKADRDAAYWRHMMLAVSGLAVAGVCLIHTLLICWAMGG